MKNNLFLVCLLSLIVDLTAPIKTAVAVDLFKGPILANTPSGDPISPTVSKRMALVIGNTDYIDQPLQNPLKDARAISNRLRAIGFEVIHLENASRRQLEQSLAAFSRRGGETEISLLYFAGHGAQLEESVLLMPADAETGSMAAVHSSGIELDHVIQQMTLQHPQRTNLFIVDACLNNPFRDTSPLVLQDANTMALPVALPERTLLAFATSSGTVAFDGEYQGSLYTEELVNALSVPGLGIEEIFKHVEHAVSRRTGARQIPMTLSTLESPLHLVPFTAAKKTSREAVNLSPIPENRLLGMLTRGILPTDGEAQYELEFWQSIKDSTDAADYEAYLEAYPDGKFAPLAKSRAERYKKSTSQEPALKFTEMDDRYEVVRNANIRETPSSRSKRLGELRKGSAVHVTGKSTEKNWYQIETSTGVTGYVFGELLRKPEPPATPQRVPAAAPVVTSAKPPEKPAAPVSTTKVEVIRDCASCPEMLVLQPATFTMGDNNGDRSERPAHQVSIKHPFAIGKHEVTTKQWNDCVKAGACSYRPENDGPSDNSPARDISWSDAQEYVRWLSKVTKQKYRLPTEAEWEYAARAGTQTRFWWGDKTGVGKADCKDCRGKWSRDAPAEVDFYTPNPFGLHGTSGGVWEWVADCWHKSYQGAPKDGSSWNKPDCRENVIRGGAWRNDASYIHSASRFKYDANVRYLLNGFRVAKTLQ